MRKERSFILNYKEPVKELCSCFGVSVNKLENEILEFGNGVVNRWDSSIPGADKVFKVCHYFGISMDDLTKKALSAAGHQESSFPTMKGQQDDDNTSKLLTIFSELTDLNKGSLIERAKVLLEEQLREDASSASKVG